MKRLLILLLFSTVLLSSCQYQGDQVLLVEKLPDTELYSMDGHHLDLGVSFKEDGVNVLGIDIPIDIQGSPKYVLFYKSKVWEFDKYDWHTFTLSDDEVQLFVDMYDIPPVPQLSWWRRMGGKIVFYSVTGILVLLFVIGFIAGIVKKKE